MNDLRQRMIVHSVSTNPSSYILGDIKLQMKRGAAEELDPILPHEVGATERIFFKYRYTNLRSLFYIRLLLTVPTEEALMVQLS